MNRIAALAELDPARYQRHPTHTEAARWSEKNCYVDVWLELLHAMRLEPMAMLPFTLSLDFLGDQWTFYKPSHDDLYEMYGLEVQELTVWRTLAEHAREHLGAGRLISIESDAYWLPDTTGTDYRTQRTKTTIVINAVDFASRRVEYFHNASYHMAEGEDFDHILAPEGAMPFFAELVIPARRQQLDPATLRRLARARVRRHLHRRPATNPVARFHARLLHDVPWLHDQGIEHYHAWAFATTRQLGSAFELAAQHLRWLDGGQGQPELAIAANAFDTISERCKTFILKGARMVMGRRPMNDGPMFEEMARSWDEGMSALERAVEGMDIAA